MFQNPKHYELFAQDERGQYRVENGEKIYQRSDCGSCYKLDSNENLLKRVSDVESERTITIIAMLECSQFQCIPVSVTPQNIQA